MKSALASRFRRPLHGEVCTGWVRPLAERSARSAVLFPIAAAMMLVSWLLPAVAQGRSAAVGSTYVQRPLTLPEGVLEVNAGPRRPYFGGQIAQAGQLQWTLRPNEPDTFVFSPGVAYGLLPDVELGVVWPTVFAPEVNLSDISFYGQYQLQGGAWEIAGYGEIRIPIESNLELTAGLPIQLHLSPQLRVDTGAFFRMILRDPVFGALHLPLGLLVQISEQLALGPELGVEVLDFEEVNVPVGVLGVWSLSNGLSTTGDLLFRLGLVDFAQGFEQVRFDVGVQLYFGG